MVDGRRREPVGILYGSITVEREGVIGLEADQEVQWVLRCRWEQEARARGAEAYADLLDRMHRSGGSWTSHQERFEEESLRDSLVLWTALSIGRATEGG